jgi:hypothetical protein
MENLAPVPVGRVLKRFSLVRTSYISFLLLMWKRARSENGYPGSFHLHLQPQFATFDLKSVFSFSYAMLVNVID